MEGNMRLTELLVTGFDGDSVVLATNVTAESAEALLAGTAEPIAIKISPSFPAFAILVRTLERLVGEPAVDAENGPVSMPQTSPCVDVRSPIESDIR
jgi:hypothetical protein